jgi:hypothetical protein
MLPDDAIYGEQVVRQRQAGLVIVDPLMAFMHGRINTWNDQRG